MFKLLVLKIEITPKLRKTNNLEYCFYDEENLILKWDLLGYWENI